jgi:hypothetical protein
MATGQAYERTLERVHIGTNRGHSLARCSWLWDVKTDNRIPWVQGVEFDGRDRCSLYVCPDTSLSCCMWYSSKSLILPRSQSLSLDALRVALLRGPGTNNDTALQSAFSVQPATF